MEYCRLPQKKSAQIIWISDQFSRFPDCTISPGTERSRSAPISPIPQYFRGKQKNQ